MLGLKVSAVIKVKYSDLVNIYDTQISKNMKSKGKLLKFEEKKVLYLMEAKHLIENNLYFGVSYKIFLTFRPKLRVITNQSVLDKVINHYVCDFILKPKLEKYLCSENCATRKGKGTSYAIKLTKKHLEKMKKYDEFYILKLDLKKYFYNIDHDILKSLLISDLDDDEFLLVSRIIDSTNQAYVNKVIDNLSISIGQELPNFAYNKGLPIGANTSQFLAIFYLHKIHHFIKHDLKIKFFCTYMDDYILMHQDKKYLEKVLKILEEKLYSEYKLKLNKKKTMIVKASFGVVFLGRKFIVKNKKTIVKLTKSSKKNIEKNMKEKYYLYNHEQISFMSLFAALQNYKHGYKDLKNKDVQNLLEKF